MADSPRVHHYYYSAYHLAGDFIWGVGTASLFLTAAAILFEGLRSDLWCLVTKLDHLDSSSLALLGAVLYTLVAAAVAVIAQRAALGLWWIVRGAPGNGESLGFRRWYKLRTQELSPLYRRHFAHDTGDSIENVSPNDMINRLIAYMKLYNPEGYNHVYRTYSIVALFRESIFYIVMLAVGEVALGPRIWPIVVLFAGVVTSLSCLQLTIGRSVAAEFDFIFSTSRWIEDQRSLASSEPPHKQT